MSSTDPWNVSYSPTWPKDKATLKRWHAGLLASARLAAKQDRPWFCDGENTLISPNCATEISRLFRPNLCPLTPDNRWFTMQERTMAYLLAAAVVEEELELRLCEGSDVF
jgi:hypothetical protein